MNNSNSSANLQSNMFGAELARYYTDDDDVEEIEVQSFPVETRFNGKRVRVMDEEDDNPAMQTSIPAQQHAKPKKLTNKNKLSTNLIRQAVPLVNTQFTFSFTPTPPVVTTNHKPKKKERKKRNTKQLKEI